MLFELLVQLAKEKKKTVAECKNNASTKQPLEITSAWALFHIQSIGNPSKNCHFVETKIMLNKKIQKNTFGLV